MRQPTQHPQRIPMLLIVWLALGCTLASFGLSHFFPQGAKWLEDWQLSHWSAQPLAQSIVLIRADDRSPALCGAGRWHLDVLQVALSALHQAGASVIAPLVDISLPVPPECGGLGGFVKLAEVTKHIGTVVYPDSVPLAIKQSALQTGMVTPPFRGNEVGDSFRLGEASFSSPHLPFGIAVASSFQSHEAPLFPHSFLSVSKVIVLQDHGVSPHHSFTHVWQWIEDGQQDELTRLFKEKVVFLYTDTPWNSGSSDAQTFSGPPALFHAQLANRYLTNSWVTPVSFPLAFFAAFGLNCLIIVPFVSQISPRKLGFISGGGMLLVILLVVVGVQWGWLWPLFDMGLTIALTIGGMGAWKFWQTRETVNQHIVRREQQLKHFEENLTEKQHQVRRLAEELSMAQHQSNESGMVIEELQVAQHSARAQLERYQVEVHETHRRIERLQEELCELRQQVPVAHDIRSEMSQVADEQALIQECVAHKIVTRDPAVLGLFQNLKKAAATQVPILILGETGTGKEVFAQAAHALSPRRHGPFISVNMAAIRSELFEGELFGHVKGAFTGAVGRMGFLESAHGGTLFLDEVGDLPLELQAKLLRFLEDGGFHRVGQSVVTHVDVRIVAATNRDLQDEVRAGRYREDLYYRLRSIVLTLPPLRERNQADHALLAQSFLKQFSQSQHRSELAFTQGALNAIIAYHWPGNIRELRQTIAQAAVLANGNVITEAELKLAGPRPGALKGNRVRDDVGQQEDAMVLACLRQHHFDMQATATALGWDRGTVTQRLKGLGFQALVEHHEDLRAAACSLAGDENLAGVVENRLREYAKNLFPKSKQYATAEEAIADCRKRFRNLPDRHFPAVARLIQAKFLGLTSG